MNQFSRDLCGETGTMELAFVMILAVVALLISLGISFPGTTLLVSALGLAVFWLRSKISWSIGRRIGNGCGK